MVVLSTTQDHSIIIDAPSDEEIQKPTLSDEQETTRIQALILQTNMVVFTCTYYPTINDLRLHQCLQTLKYATTVPIVVVDGSPPEVHELLKSINGAIVRREEGICGKGKGGALREAAQVAASLPGVTNDTLLCWQEAEKSHMMECWQKEVLAQCVPDDDVICPAREDGCFKKSYPIEQYHSESYGNYYLNCVMKGALAAEKERGNAITCGPIDWHFGPFALRRKLLHLWMEYKGTSYDAQLLPIVFAIRKGYQVNSSIEVSFELDGQMKEQEEGSLNFIEKRLHQLNDLDPKVKQSWKDDFYC